MGSSQVQKGDLTVEGPENGGVFLMPGGRSLQFQIMLIDKKGEDHVLSGHLHLMQDRLPVAPDLDYPVI
jgi:hypothetical protein